MTKGQIEEGNKTIAKFMGEKWDIETYDGRKGLFVFDSSFENIDREISYRSIDSVILALEKIATQYASWEIAHRIGLDANGTIHYICSILSYDNGISCTNISTSLVDSCFMSVLDYIAQYNEIKNQ